MRALFLVLMLLAFPVKADSIARQGADWVRLTLKPCADVEVVAALVAKGKHPDAYRAGHAFLGGRSYEACWQPTHGGAGLVYSDGDTGFVPMEDLKPAPEA